MKSKLIVSVMMAMAVGSCAFAANPFADVPADSWAYKSVVELADAGVIQGVDGTYFQGQRNITRYEAAEMVAKAMTHMDQASLQQRSLINKLASEYANELNSLGVRVSNLEKNVGNVKVSGDLRIRYIHQKDGYTGDDGNTKSDQFSLRPRLRFDGTIDQNTSATVRLLMTNYNQSFDDSAAATHKGNNPYINMAYVTHDFGKDVNLLVGRWEYSLGNGLAIQHYDEFDGAQLIVKRNKLTFTGGYGKFREGAFYTPAGYTITNVQKDSGDHNLTGVKTGYASIDGDFGKIGLGVYYNGFNGEMAASQNLSHLWGGYLKYNFTSKLNILGDYQKVYKDKATSDDDNAALWGAQLTYGSADMDKAGSWDAWLEYINADQNVLYGSTNSWRNCNLLDDVRSWGVGIDYILTKNVRFSAMQSFASSAKSGSVDPDEMTRAEFMFAF